MNATTRIAAIDAGSNAIRMVIVRADSPGEIRILASERRPVRLGHNVFTRGVLDKRTIGRAAKAFRHFRERIDHFHVEAYRAVTTSAAREARNRRALLERVEQKAKLRLEVINNGEEARLVRAGVLAALDERIAPRLIVDLGGGSLEINLMRGGALEHSVALPLGTVRLMETYRIEGSVTVDEEEEVRGHVLALLREHIPQPPNLLEAACVASGGNAEALADLAPGPAMRGVDTINLRLLRERLDAILTADVRRRMKLFRVRRDRAEVMGMAAIVFDVLGRYFSLRNFLVPRAGVREGILSDLLAAHFAPPPEVLEDRVSEKLRAAVRGLAQRLNYDAPHSEHVRRTALSLFDQLLPLHRLDGEMRLLLELGALLHDVGCFINRQAHHRHGEYLVRHAELPALRGWRRQFVAALVRYHNTKSEPEAHHPAYSELDGDRRHQVRVLAALLRLAEALDEHHPQSVMKVEVAFTRKQAVLRVATRGGVLPSLPGVERRGRLFEREFGVKLSVRRAQARRDAA